MTTFQQLWLGVALCVTFLLVTGMILSGGTGLRHVTEQVTAPVLTALNAEPRHTSPSQTLRDDWPPIFAALAQERGYDPVRGFDGLVTT